jgi:ubiquinone/menaquinone biosynthesis C-methylase UbiE
LLKENRNIELTGVDFSREAIKQVMEKGMQGKTSDSSSIPFQDSAFDVVTSLELLEHILPEKREETLREMCRVCKSQGNIFVTVPTDFNACLPQHEHEHLTVYSKPKLRNLLRNYLDNVEISSSKDSVFLIAYGQNRK